MSDKPKRDYSHLKQYQFKKGHKKLPGAGRPKGALEKNTKVRIALEVLRDAFNTCPKTGKWLTYKQIRKRLSQGMDQNIKLLLEYIDREIGKIPSEAGSAPTVFIMNPPEGSKQVTNLDDNEVIEGEVEQFQLSKADESD